MAELPKENASAFVQDANVFNEDFEKLERPDDVVPDQDEQITSTSFSGAEGEQETNRPLIGTESNDDKINSSDQLLSFDDEPNRPVPSAPMQPISGMDAFSDLSDLVGRPQTSVQEIVDPLPSHTLPEPTFTSSLTEPKDVQKVSEVKPSADQPMFQLPVPFKFQAAPWMKNIDPRVLDLVYWKDVKKTGVVFGSMLFLMLSLAFFSVLSVVAYLSLAVLTVTFSFRVYKNILAAVQKTGEGHPFKQYLEMNTELSDEKVEKATKNILSHLNCTVRELRRLFLVEDYVDSVKYALLLWVFTYIGSWFNGMTLLIMGLVLLFTVPKVYDTYKVQIDEYINLACTQLNNLMAQVQTKLPFLKKKSKTQ